MFEKYEEYWPPRFILKRLARELGVKPQDNHLAPPNPSQSPSSVSATGFDNRSTLTLTYAKPPLLKIAYTCPVHPGPDQAFVAPAVQRCLQSRGLTDLIPVFALMGISTEEEFEEFCELSAVEKDEAVIAAGIKVNAFQNLALKLELWEDMLGASDS